MSDAHARGFRLVGGLVVLLAGWAAVGAAAADAEPPGELEREIAYLKAFYLAAISERPPPSLEEMVASLGQRSGLAGRRYLREVVAQPAAALPLLHARLAAPPPNPRANAPVIVALTAIRDPSSVAPILAAAKASPPELRFGLWQALWILPPSEAVRDYALAVASDPELDLGRKKAAYVALALHREERARPLAEALLTRPDPDERAIGVMILGFLRADVREPAAEILGSRELAPGKEQGPLLGLAEIAGPDELRALVPGFRQQGERWQQALRRSTWRHAPPSDPEPRAALCVELMRDPLPPHGPEGVRCLLQLGRQDLLLRDVLALKGERGALVLGMLQREGWRLVVADQDVRLEESPPAVSSPGPRKSPPAMTGRPRVGPQ